jgi:diguanylate cyclase (GGDEF)-like protein/PAS domain S-box-containing protein
MSERVIRVLLVEEDEDASVLTRDLLSRSTRGRFSVECASGYDDGLARAVKDGVDVCLVSRRLGARDGTEWTREAIGAGCGAPIILLMGQAGGENEGTALGAGAADFLVRGQLSQEILERSILYAVRQAHAEAALRASEERYSLVGRAANDGLWDWDILRKVACFSPRWKEMVGCADAEIGDSPEEWFRRVHPSDVGRLKADIQSHLEGRTSRFQSEHRIRRRDGMYLTVLGRGLCVRDTAGRAYRFAGSLTDLSELRQSEMQLAYEASHDTLTDLPNRSAFLERLEEVASGPRVLARPAFAVLCIDVDRFKIVNEGLGHGVGDRLLVAVTQRLRSSLRPGDLIARLGGDEFGVLLEHLQTVDTAREVAERLVKELFERPLEESGHAVPVSVSVGVAAADSTLEGGAGLLRDADVALSRAKDAGGGCIEVFTPEMRGAALSRLELEKDLRAAVRRGEMCLHYQPIVALSTCELAGFEALLRWAHPTRGLVAPAQFLPFAEETGLIREIGRWALYEACRQMREWLDAWPAVSSLYMAVNLSRRQFVDSDLAAMVCDVLKEVGCPPESLKLEITESSVMPDPDLAAAVLEGLRGLGVTTAIDDFGTGYSSLECLQHLPCDTLKVDRVFVSRLDGTQRNAEIVNTVLGLAQRLDLTVVAEGIETEAQLAELRMLGCPLGQGFLFGRPADPAEAQAIFSGTAGSEERDEPRGAVEDPGSSDRSPATPA